MGVNVGEGDVDGEKGGKDLANQVLLKKFALQPDHSNQLSLFLSSYQSYSSKHKTQCSIERTYPLWLIPGESRDVESEEDEIHRVDDDVRLIVGHESVAEPEGLTGELS